MSLTRKFLKVFGLGGADANFARFGSRAAEAPVETKDIDSIQQLNAWDNGLQATLLPGQTRPFLEDLNALFHVFGYQLAYLFQDGIPEWNADTEYRIGSIVRKAGTFELYGSVANANTNNALPNKANNTFWQYLNPSSVPAGIISGTIATVAPFGYLMMDGGSYSKAAYADLYAVGGPCITDDPGDATKFKLKDLRGRALIGAGQGAGLTIRALGDLLGAETHAHTQDAHSHLTPIVYQPGGALSVAQNPFGKGGNASGLVNATFAGSTPATPGGSEFQKTDTAAPTIQPSSSYQPSAAVNWIVKY